MSSSEFAIESGGGISGFAIRVRDVSKHYVMFERPEDRFKQMVVPRLERLIGRPPRRYFRDFAALSDISFEIGRGETVGIIGRNGSGKSTLLQIICGTLQPTTGSVEVNGRIAALLELGAGFNPEFTGRENVFLNASILGVPRKEMEWRFDDIARFADIGPFIDQPVKTYSSGMYVRLAFATAINVDPDILVVDEALSVGDEAFQRKCFARIEEIKDKGGTILFVSHGAQTIVQLCSRAMLVDAGELILEGRPKTVVAQYQRLVNASSEGAGEIRASILQADEALRVGGGTNGTPSSATKTEVAEPNRDENNRILKYADYFDPALKSQSTVYLEERGARIHDARILTLSGERVNVLQLGKRYVFEYFVNFSAQASNVGFGMFVKALNGAGLGGANSKNTLGLQLKSVSGGTIRRVQYEFECGFLPGTYAVNCGVTGTVGGDGFVMHRVIDVELFRVASEPNMIGTGFFNIEPMLTVSSESEFTEKA
ncbi:MAG: ABC transporter ATP-binding protein [Mesorhizobium sp.]|nr:MAG: ABC transporter ATP-binding protein [Mesorhizobium sp.]TJV24021.1 MAG: ABC transporter ATP-binding protein [Mesorhizobium sp.]